MFLYLLSALTAVFTDYVSQARGAAWQTQSLERVPASVVWISLPLTFVSLSKTALSQRSNICDRLRFADYSEQHSSVCCVNKADMQIRRVSRASRNAFLSCRPGGNRSSLANEVHSVTVHLIAISHLLRVLGSIWNFHVVEANAAQGSSSISRSAIMSGSLAKTLFTAIRFTWTWADS